MSKADGSVVIDTELKKDGLIAGTKEVEASMRRMASTVDGIGKKAEIALQKQVDAFVKLNQQYAQQEKKVKSLEDKLEELGNVKVETDEYKALQNELSDLEDKFMQVKAKQKEWLGMGFPVDSSPLKALDKQLDEIWADMEKVRIKQEQMKSSGTAYKNPLESAAYQTTNSKLIAEEQKLDQMNTKLNTSYSSVKEKVNQYSKSLLGLDKNSKKVNRSMKDTKKSADGAHMSMGRMLRNSILFSMVFRAISTVTNGIKEGMNNLAQYSGKTNASLSMLMSALTRLKNSFATAFAPVLNVAAPILTTFINLISRAVTYVGMLFAALTGQQSFVKATGVQQDYAASLGNTADKAEDTADALKDAEKAQNSYLSGLDEINRYESKKKDSGNSTTSPETGELLPGDMFETVPIENSMKSFAEKIKGIFADIFKPFQQAWQKEGQATINAAKTALSNIGSLAKSVGKSLMEVWTNGTGEKMLSTMLQIGQNVLKTIGNITKKLDEAWNKNKVGTKIIQNIAKAVQSVLDFVNRIAKATAEWAANLDFYPLLQSIERLTRSLSPLIETIGNVLSKIYENIILPAMKWLIEVGLPNVINAVSSFLDFLSKNQWIIEAVGAALIGAFAAAKIVPAITKIVGSIKTLSTGIKAVVKAITGAGGFKAAISAVTGLLSGGGGLALAIGAVVAAGVLLIANWDDIKKWAKDTWKSVSKWVSDSCKKAAKEVSKKWGEIKKSLSNTWDFIQKKAKNAFEAVSYTVKDAWNKAKSFTTTIWGNINSWASSTWDSLRTKASSVFDSIKGSISNAWNNARSWTTSTWSSIKSSVSSTWSSISSTASSKFNGIASAVSSAWNKAKTSTTSIWGSISKTVSGVWSSMVGTAKSVGSRIASGITSGLRSLPNTLYNLGRSAISSLVRGINSLASRAWSSIRNFASSVSSSISSVFRRSSLPTMTSAPAVSYAAPAKARIPYLASGAVIPPRAEFLAVLGDQRHGNNIEAPESLLRKIVREESSGNTGGGTYRFVGQINRRVLFEEFMAEAQLVRSQSGRNPFEMA